MLFFFAMVQRYTFYLNNVLFGGVVRVICGGSIHGLLQLSRYVLVFAQELTLSQKFDLKPVIDRFGGFLASYDNLYTFHTAEQAQRCSIQQLVREAPL